MEFQELNLEKEIGSSDHKCIYSKISFIKRVKPKETKYKSMNFGKIKAKSAGYFYNALCVKPIGNVDQFLNEQYNIIKPHFKYHTIKKRNFFKLITSNEKKIQEGKVELNSFNKIIQCFNRAEYKQFLFRLNKLRKVPNFVKQYFKKLSFAFASKNQGGIKIKLKINEVIIDDKEEIDKLIEKKYYSIFSDNKDYKEFYQTTSSNYIQFNELEIEVAIGRISVGKAISQDGISDDCITLFAKDKCIEKKRMFLSNLFKIINEILKNRKFPDINAVARLFPLNKIEGELASLDSVRPINITSLIVKIYESILLDKLSDYIKKIEF